MYIFSSPVGVPSPPPPRSQLLFMGYKADDQQIDQACVCGVTLRRLPTIPAVAALTLWEDESLTSVGGDDVRGSPLAGAQVLRPWEHIWKFESGIGHRQAE